jgi:hypothetical protein
LDGTSASRKAATYTEKHKHRNTHRDIHASSGIRTHYLSVLFNEGISCSYYRILTMVYNFQKY